MGLMFTLQNISLSVVLSQYYQNDGILTKSGCNISVVIFGKPFIRWFTNPGH